MEKHMKNDVSIKGRLLFRFGVITLVMIVIGLLFIFSSRRVSSVREEAIVLSNKKMKLQQAVADHYSWSSKLNASVAYGREFDGSTDPTKCRFGTYIYSDEIQNDPEWDGLLSEIEPLHNRIHEGALSILSLTDPAEVQALYADSIEPALNSLVEVLNRESAGLDLKIAAAQESERLASNAQMAMVFVQMLVLFALLALTFRYINQDVVAPLVQIGKESKLLAEGVLSLDFAMPCRNSDIRDLGVSLNASVAEIKKYVSDIARAMGEMSNRNLNVTPSQPFIGDFKPIEDSIGKMLVDLTGALSQFETASSQVSDGSSQVSAGAQALAQGATEQASSVEELAATVAEVSNKISQNAESAIKAGQMAQGTTDAITSSNQQMLQMLSAMEEIDARSKEIGNIIKAIEDIAFQTNILALNAAVEAARAGAAGKGFAVVADEVRNLAGKSAQAAQNTTELIKASIQSISRGVDIAKTTAADMEKVVESSVQTSEIIGKIADATQEQAGAIAQINTGLEQISTVIQTNSATSQESAAASEELSGQAEVLKNLIGTFSLFQGQ